MATREPQLVMTTGRNGEYVVIDSLVNDTSSGGVRIAEDISLDEVKTLAREMSLKYSFIGLPRGGAKCGIQLSPGTPSELKREILEDFGRSIGPIVRKGIYNPGMDMNCSSEDLKVIWRGAGIELDRLTDTSYFTAISVANAICACKETMGLGHSFITIALEGFGRVATHLAERLAGDDYRIVAISTLKGAARNQNGFNVQKLLGCRREFGADFVNRLPDAEMIEKGHVLTADVDILVPSARTWAINEDNATGVSARAIVPIANAPYAEGTIQILHQRGVVALPGFVANSGGVYASSLFDDGMSIGEIEKVSATHYRAAVSNLVKKSGELKLPPTRLAEMIAIKRQGATNDRPRSFCARSLKKVWDNLPLLERLRSYASNRDIVRNLEKLGAEIAKY